MSDLGAFADQLADLTSHHIEGIAVMGNTPFTCPIISHVEGHLWQGGYLETSAKSTPLPGFEYVLSLYPWRRYDTVAYRREERLYDHGDVPDQALLEELADWVNEKRLIGPTLVHCQAGLNRSALVTALALVRAKLPLTAKTPSDAIALLRDQRSPAVLCNSAFERWLLAYEPTGD